MTEAVQDWSVALKVFVTGAGGQVGQELADLLPRRGHETVTLTRHELDVADFESVLRALDEHAPDVVINAAAYTAVDRCETETELAYEVNASGPRNLAQHCRRRGCELLHISTNYVFDGGSDRPYEPFDPAFPINAYGRTKLAGEEYVKHLAHRWYIVRSAGIYGRRHNFVRTVLRVAEEKGSIRVKEDEFISPTYARDLANGIIGVIESREYGVYHLTNAGSCSWYEFAREVLQLTGAKAKALPIPSSEYPLPASRPANGVLSNVGSPRLRPWQDALKDYLEREVMT